MKELFTPEALEACPHARAMFEQMKQLGATPVAQPVALAEPNSPAQRKAPVNFQAATSPTTEWPPTEAYSRTLAGAARNVPDNSLKGREEADFRAFTRDRIQTIQARQLKDNDSMRRLVHTKQLFGGEVEVHWNPNLEKVVDLFGHQSLGGLIRISDASNEETPDGKNMYGMALELVGNDGQLTDILMTGGSEATEASQARDPEAQLALFNMLDHPFKIGGLVQMGFEVGAIEAGKMVLDVGRMKSDLDSVAELTAWSRAPFRLKGKDGDHYLVKMRAVPIDPAPGKAADSAGETTSQRLVNEFQSRIEKGEARWRFDLQFMKPGDDPNDGRKTWGGEWLPAGEIVIPRVTDQVRAEEIAQAAENTKFNIWKGKEEHDKGPDLEVFYPHGWTNQARLWAYGQSAANRGVGA
ncbi:MAG: hypothetical protein WC423_04745 [Vulcanimicrobiota bacterium]